MPARTCRRETARPSMGSWDEPFSRKLYPLQSRCAHVSSAGYGVNRHLECHLAERLREFLFYLSTEHSYWTEADRQTPASRVVATDEALNLSLIYSYPMPAQS